MSLATVRAEIKTVLDGVSGIGRTHDYLRYGNDETTRNKHFVTPAGKLEVWMITNADDNPFLTVDSKGQPGRNPSNYEMGRYRFLILGYMALEDATASEKTFEARIEAIVAAFRAAKRLGNTTVIDSGPLQWTVGGHASFPPGDGGTLCHQARLELPVLEQKEP